MKARILSWARKPPADGTTHRSTRRLGDRLGVPHTVVQRAWKRGGLQPHRLERYLRSIDRRSIADTSSPRECSRHYADGENGTHTPADAVPVACAPRFRSRAPNVVSAERAHRRRSLWARPQIAGQSIRRNCVPN
jgi:hypothetical protein